MPPHDSATTTAVQTPAPPPSQGLLPVPPGLAAAHQAATRREQAAINNTQCNRHPRCCHQRECTATGPTASTLGRDGDEETEKARPALAPPRVEEFWGCWAPGGAPHVLTRKLRAVARHLEMQATNQLRSTRSLRPKPTQRGRGGCTRRHMAITGQCRQCLNAGVVSLRAPGTANHSQ